MKLFSIVISFICLNSFAQTKKVSKSHSAPSTAGLFVACAIGSPCNSYSGFQDAEMTATCLMLDGDCCDQTGGPTAGTVQKCKDIKDIIPLKVKSSSDYCSMSDDKQWVYCPEGDYKKVDSHINNLQEIKQKINKDLGNSSGSKSLQN